MLRHRLLRQPEPTIDYIIEINAELGHYQYIRRWFMTMTSVGQKAAVLSSWETSTGSVRLIGLFPASDHPVQGVSHAALNALTAERG
jgi:hypothetical protein